MKTTFKDPLERFDVEFEEIDAQGKTMQQFHQGSYQPERKRRKVRTNMVGHFS